MRHHHHHHESSAEKNISIAFFLNLFFVVVEIVGGILTNSIAILLDAIHDIGDCLSLAVSWIFQKKSAKPGDNKYNYGYKRFSLLGSLFLSMALLASSSFVLVKACGRLFQPEEVHAKGMLWLAVLGIIINGAAAFRVKSGHTQNERSVYLHIMEDVLGWVAVLLASVVMMFWDNPLLDPVLSIGISLWVLYHVIHNTKDAMKILLQAAPENFDVEKLKQEITALPGILQVKELCLWSLDGESHVMSLRLLGQRNNDTSKWQQDIRRQIRNLAEKRNIVHCTIELED